MAATAERSATKLRFLMSTSGPYIPQQIPLLGLFASLSSVLIIATIVGVLQAQSCRTGFALRLLWSRARWFCAMPHPFTLTLLREMMKQPRRDLLGCQLRASSSLDLQAPIPSFISTSHLQGAEDRSAVAVVPWLHMQLCLCRMGGQICWI